MEQPTNPSDQSTSGFLLAPGVFVSEGDIEFSFVKSSGPGGQNVNKRSTKAQLRISLECIEVNELARARLCRLAGSMMNSKNELIISDDSTRSQSRNKAACIDRLKELVVRALVVPKNRKSTKPSRGSIERRIAAKKQRSDIKKSRGWSGNE